MGLILTLLNLYSYVVIISALISWVPIPQDNPLVQVLHALTEPVYAPIRAVLDPSKTGGIDLSPLIVLVLINVLKRALFF